ncbi:unnamed protein product, partial [Vitis vinifera]
MAEFQNPDLEYVVDDYYDMTDFEEDSFSETDPQRNSPFEAFDSDVEDNFEMNKPKTDTSALEARNGKDIQGIPWERLNFTRDKYRETRLEQYKNYENLSRPREELEKDCKKIEKGSTFYDFQFNTRLVKSTIVHFQFCRFCKYVIILSFMDIFIKIVALLRSVPAKILLQNVAIGALKAGWKLYLSSWRNKDTLFIWRVKFSVSMAQMCVQVSKISILYNLLCTTGTIICTSSILHSVACFYARILIFRVELAFRYHCCEWPFIYNGMAGIIFSLDILRNLLWATSKHDVYLMQNYSVMHWSSLLRRGKEVLNVAKPIVSTLKCPGSLGQSLSRVQISTMTVKENLMVAGGFQGELICKNLSQPGVAFCAKLTTDDNAITNAVDVYHNPNGSLRVMAANNDAEVRIFDAENFACLNRFTYPWSVNNTSVSPDGKLLAVLGDSAECLLADAQTGKVVATLKGHLDYSFASAWHPDGRTLATGNQDTTCRLWDIRNLSESQAVLKGRMGAIRAVRFSSDGRFMAMAEPADFVHVFDTESGYVKGQEIDLFGEIAGISFSPDTEALFVGIADRTYGSLLEFNRRRCNQYLDSII